MELRDMIFFRTAAETEHISRAADSLGVSQPFLTKIISQLEDELGCQLFDHVGRRVQLNKYGRTLLTSVNKILDEVDNIHSSFDSMLDEPDYPVRFAVGSSAYCSDIPLLYRQAFPDSSITREYMERRQLITALETGEADFAICSPPISEKESEQIVSQVVHKERACLIMPSSAPLSAKEYVTLADLDGLPLITTLKGSDTRNNIDIMCAAYGVKPSIIYETIDNNLIIKMVADGMGSTVFAWNYASQLPPSDKYAIREFSDSVGEIALCRNINAPLSKAKERFISFVNDYFSKLD